MSRRLTTDAFIEKACAVHGDVYDYSKADYHSYTSKVEIVCRKHGSFLQRVDAHLRGQGCPHPECVDARRRQTCRTRYGGDGPMCSAAVREKSKKTCLEKYGVENTGSAPEVRQRMAEGCMAKYGVKNVFELPEMQEKARNTVFEKYGVHNCMHDASVRARQIQTCLDRYGVDNPQKNAEIHARTRDTCLLKYGAASPLESAEIQEKVKQTCLTKYGVEYALASPIVQQQIRDRCQALFGVDWVSAMPGVQDKVAAAKRRNHTFNVSGSEDALYETLCSRFGADDVVRQYVSEAYPFACDFYIKSRNLYIELNASWTHGGGWFEESDADDIAQRDFWQQSGTEYYLKAIETWTVRDVTKRAAARCAGLNYIVFWDNSLKDAALWFDSGMPDGRDYEKSYSWLPEE